MAPKRKLQKRVKDLGAQVEASIREDGEDHKFHAAASNELFQIDSKGVADRVLTKKQKLHQKDPMVKSRKFDSAKASKFMIEKLKKLQAIQKQAEPPLDAVVSTSATTSAAAVAKALHVWGSDGAVAPPAELALIDEYVAPTVAPQIKPRKLHASTAHKIASVQVAAPGQSYHPTFDAHQDVLAEAVAHELEHRDKLAELAKPVTAGMSDETLQFIDARDSADDASESDDDDVDNATQRRHAKRPAAVTRSQRNKRVRHKHMELEHSQRRQEKSIIKQINTAGHILQDIIRDEKAADQKQELKKVMEEQKLDNEPELVRVGGKRTKIVRETAVAFTEELTGALRTLTPKGSLLLERYDSLHKRNMITVNGPRQTRKRKVKIIEAKK